MSSSAGQPVILYHKCLSRPFIRGFGQLGAGTRRDTRLPEEGGREDEGDGAAGQEQKLLAPFPTQEVQGDCSPDGIEGRETLKEVSYYLLMDGARRSFQKGMRKKRKRQRPEKLQLQGCGQDRGRGVRGQHFCCELAFLTCQTPTMALAIRMSRMTNGSTKAVIESSSSSKKANT